MVGEKKLAIYSQALRNAPESVPLLEGYLRLCRELKPAHELQQLWDAVLSARSGSMRLWRTYVSWRMAHLSSFTVTAMRETLAAALSAANGVASKEGSAKVNEAEQQLVWLMQTIGSLESGSGHHARGLACWQAAIEFSCCCPTSLQSLSLSLRQVD